MRKPFVIILGNENPDDHLQWVNACQSKKNIIDYEVINLSKSDWYARIMNKPNADYYLSRPPGLTTAFKQLYDERLTILVESLHLPVFPRLPECLVYENKRLLSYWLMVNKIPHPVTTVIYNKEEALNYSENQMFPVVAKINIGASGSGVTILQNKKQAVEYINNSFSGKGIKRRSGPNLEKGGIFKRGMHYVRHPAEINKKLRIYKSIGQEIQRGFIIFQEYIKHNFEWRVVRVGDSFFAHKKLVKNKKASGSLQKSYEKPPNDLLDFVKSITDKHKFYSQAVDIFVSEEGYLVNEMQCIFGQADPYQMLIDGKPGRYVYKAGEWVFEEGDFAINQCFDLRLEYILNELI